MGASFAKDLNIDPRQSGGMGRCGELDSMAEFHVIEDDPSGYDCFQIFEPYLGLWHLENVGIQVGLFEQKLVLWRERIVPVAGHEFKVKFHIFPDAVDVTVVPSPGRVEVSVCVSVGCLTCCSLVRDQIHRIRWSEQHINSPTVRFPPCKLTATSKLTAILFVGENDTPVVFGFEIGVFSRAAIPKLFNKLLSRGRYSDAKTHNALRE